jgi:hypothetical protein
VMFKNSILFAGEFLDMGNAPGPRLFPDHGFQQPETHLPLPSNSMVRSLIAR